MNGETQRVSSFEGLTYGIRHLKSELVWFVMYKLDFDLRWGLM